MSTGFSIAVLRRLPVPFLLLGMILAGVPARSAGSTPVGRQAADTLGYVAGIVRSADGGMPLAGAMVVVMSTGGSAITHGDGSFRIDVPDAGQRYRLRIDRLGYAAVVADVRPGQMATVDLEVAAIPLADVVVTAVLSPTAANETIRPSAVFAREKLQRHLAGTLAQTVASVPGVAVTSMGPGTSQPVIRGLGGDRILLLEDGQRVGDVVNSGADHATAVTPSSARRIEVIRGPSAILYGSSALGGVINVVRDEIPRAVPYRATGFTLLETQTATRAIGGSGQVTVGVTEHVPLRVEVSKREGGNLRTPHGTLAGTQTDVWSVAAGTSLVDDWGYAGGSFRFYSNDYGIPGGFVGGHTNPVRTEQERAASRFRTVFRPDRGFEAIEMDAGYTWYRHHEWETATILGTVFERQVASGEVRARHAGWGPFASGAVGARVSWEHFGFGGELYSPNTRRTTQAVYVLEEIKLNPVSLEAGLRYDRVELEPNEEKKSDIGHIRARSFSAVSGALGAILPLTERIALGASLGRAFRTPDVPELYSEGPHLAANSYDIGNPLLDTETGLGIDVFGAHHGTTPQRRGDVVPKRDRGLHLSAGDGEEQPRAAPRIPVRGRGRRSDRLRESVRVVDAGRIQGGGRRVVRAGYSPRDRRSSPLHSAAAGSPCRRLFSGGLVRGGRDADGRQPGANRAVRGQNRWIRSLWPLRRYAFDVRRATTRRNTPPR